MRAMHSRLENVARSPNAERDAARRSLSASLPDAVRTLRHQWLGSVSVGCAATWGVHERCDFSCTACYLGRDANRTPPLPFEEVAAQLDTIRRERGPGANTQITAGEVTLLPLPELTRIVRYALDIGLDPMVMSHGQTFLRDPDYLPGLLRGGLRKLSLHVDTTQRGRPGIDGRATELDLMAVRDALANEVRRARRVTGLPLHADHTVTITEGNAEHVPAIVRWTTANADAFSVLGLLPVAPVGRTRVQGRVSRESLARAVAEGLGVDAPSTFEMGHPECHAQILAWILDDGRTRRAVPVRRRGAPLDDRFVDHLTALGSASFDLHGLSRRAQVRALLGLMRARPATPAVWASYAAYRLLDGELGPTLRMARALRRGTGSVRPFAVITHWFMPPDALDTPLGRERLASCTFRVPVNGRLVPMCEMNATGLRDRLIRDARERLVPLRVR